MNHDDSQQIPLNRRGGVDDGEDDSANYNNDRDRTGAAGDATQGQQDEEHKGGGGQTEEEKKAEEESPETFLQTMKGKTTDYYTQGRETLKKGQDLLAGAKYAESLTDYYEWLSNLPCLKPCKKDRNVAANAVLTFSLLLCLCAIFIGVSAIAFEDQEFIDYFGPAKPYKRTVTYMLIITSCVTFVTGLWGIAAKVIDNKKFITVFGGVICALTVILLGFQQIFSALANIDDETITAVCPGAGVEISNDFVPLEGVYQAVLEIDRIQSLASNFMCSDTCPCLANSENIDTQFKTLTEIELNVYDRTWLLDSKTVYNPIIFYTEAEVETQTLSTFTEFGQCAQDIIDNVWVPTNEDAILMIKGSAIREGYQDAVNVSGFLYDKYECAGFCYDVLFDWSSTFTNGRIADTCQDGVKREMYLIFGFPSIVALIGAITAAVTLPVQYVLWKKFEKAPIVADGANQPPANEDQNEGDKENADNSQDGVNDRDE